MRISLAALSILILLSVDEVKGDSICPPTVAPGGYDSYLPCIIHKPQLPDLGPQIYFAQHSTTLSGEAKSVLAQQAETIKKHPQLKVDLIGFADIEEAPTATEKAELAGNRAAAVRAYLIAQGIDGSRLFADGRDFAPLIPHVVNDRTLAAMRFVFARVREH